MQTHTQTRLQCLQSKDHKYAQEQRRFSCVSVLLRTRVIAHVVCVCPCFRLFAVGCWTDRVCAWTEAHFRETRRERESISRGSGSCLSLSLSLVWAFLTDGVSLDGSPSENHGSILVQSNPDHLLSSSLPPSIPLLALHPSIQCQFDRPVCLMPRPFIYPLCPAAPLLSVSTVLLPRSPPLTPTAILSAVASFSAPALLSQQFYCLRPISCTCTFLQLTLDKLKIICKPKFKMSMHLDCTVLT